MIHTVPAAAWANLLGLLLLLPLIRNNTWRFRGRRHESRLLLALFLMGALACCSDATSYLLEGIPYRPAMLVQHAATGITFLLIMLMSIVWLLFVARHMSFPVTRRFRLIIGAVVSGGVLLLLLNLFHPFVFGIREGLYYPGPLYGYFMLSGMFFLLHGLIVYLRCRSTGGSLNLFPIYSFLLPTLAGVLADVLFSFAALPAFNAIALVNILCSLKNEEIYVDPLTGAYSFAFLKELRERMSQQRERRLYGIMLDMNGFKQINDTYGHAVGDEALITTASLIREVVGPLGDVIRYAGDEFVVMLNTVDEARAEACVADIHAALERFNEEGAAPYRLSASIGCALYDTNTQSVDEFMNLIDRRMYESKAAYYRAHDRRGSRS